MRYRVHFEPVDVEGLNPDQIPSYLSQHMDQINIRKVVPIDKDGFPIQ